jgi:hypothetical protein
LLVFSPYVRIVGMKRMIASFIAFGIAVWRIWDAIQIRNTALDNWRMLDAVNKGQIPKPDIEGAFTSEIIIWGIVFLGGFILFLFGYRSYKQFKAQQQ